jgi:hypothetical protein
MIDKKGLARLSRGAALVVPLAAGAMIAAPLRAEPGRMSDASSAETDRLLEAFKRPPDVARPRVWWHWMNGNVTWDGVQKDMAWMKRVGVAGLQAFDAGMATPQVVAKRLPYMTPGWKTVFHDTAANAERLHLELGIAASPGWSETGGPWVSGRDGMKKMVWSVTRVRGGAPYAGTLAQPPKVSGIFQTSTAGWTLGGRAPGQNPPEYYADQKVLAFRLPSGGILPNPIITASAGKLDAAALSDGDLEKSAVDLPTGSATGAESWVQFDYGRIVTIRGLTLATPVASRYYAGLAGRQPGAAPTGFRLDASDDGKTWHDVGARVEAGLPERTISVDAVHARFFRFVSVRQAPLPVPSRIPRFSRPSPPPPDALPINELVLRGEATVHSFEDKAAFITNGDYYALPSGTRGDSAPKPTDVIDLTGKMRPDGRLVWTPPAGEWDVLRIGYSLTGAMNRPASPEATGLEVDKLDAAAVRRYMDHYLAMYRETTGGLMGAHGLRAMVFDSWEASNENWTPAILDDFRRLRGYDPTPWLPTLAGYVVGSAERSDAFLWDWRRTLQQLLKTNHYDQLTTMLHGIGMTRYGEAHEALFATMGDGMEMKQSADVPMAAMWQTERPGEIEPVYFNDIQESASVAHIYGQNLVATEALTGGPRFGSAPWDLKSTADAILLAGANRFVIHTSTHQPGDRGPGMTLGVGQYFTRNETWAEQAGPWIDYLSRSSLLLQQGQAVSDVAVFYGEAGPVITAYADDYPAVPNGYRYDYVNADALFNRLKVENGAVTTATGMRYRAILFGKGTERVSLPVLERVRDMVMAGAVVIGTRPLGSPSLADDPAKVKAILDELWPGAREARLGNGRVFAEADAGVALQAIGAAPDATFKGERADSTIMFLHRHLSDGDAYFVANRRDRADTVTSSFRVTGKRPELWDPASGNTRPVGYKIVGDRTEIALPLDRLGSVFVLFRAPTTQTSAIVPAPVLRPITTLAGPWRVSFQPGRGAPASATFPELADFRDNAIPGIRYFSGMASYPADVSVSAADLAGGRRVWIDLGQVHDLAEIWVNGALAGTAWKPPYRIDVTAKMRAGRNRVEVRAVNLWVNRLIGDVQPGVVKKITFTAADGKIPPGAALAEYARRMAMPYEANAPLLPSGLLGPVRVLVEDHAPQARSSGETAK